MNRQHGRMPAQATASDQWVAQIGPDDVLFTLCDSRKGSDNFQAYWQRVKAAFEQVSKKRNTEG